MDRARRRLPEEGGDGQVRRDVQESGDQCRNPFVEPLPVALIVALVSAGVLSRRKKGAVRENGCWRRRGSRREVSASIVRCGAFRLRPDSSRRDRLRLRMCGCVGFILGAFAVRSSKGRRGKPGRRSRVVGCHLCCRLAIRGTDWVHARRGAGRCMAVGVSSASPGRRVTPSNRSAPALTTVRIAAPAPGLGHDPRSDPWRATVVGYYMVGSFSVFQPGSAGELPPGRLDLHRADGHKPVAAILAGLLLAGRGRVWRNQPEGG